MCIYNRFVIYESLHVAFLLLQCIHAGKTQMLVGLLILLQLHDEEEVYEDNGINMLHGVIYDRKNLTYDELYNHIASTQSLVTCCIDAHFTAFQMLNKKYYFRTKKNIMSGIALSSGKQTII